MVLWFQFHCESSPWWPLLMFIVACAAGVWASWWRFFGRSSHRAHNFTFTAQQTRWYPWKQWKHLLKSSEKQDAWWGLAICKHRPMSTISEATRSSTVSSSLISWKRFYHQHTTFLSRLSYYYFKPFFTVIFPPIIDRMWNGSWRCLPAEALFNIVIDLV